MKAEFDFPLYTLFLQPPHNLTVAVQKTKKNAFGICEQKVSSPGNLYFDLPQKVGKCIYSITDGFRLFSVVSTPLNNYKAEAGSLHVPPPSSEKANVYTVPFIFHYTLPEIQILIWLPERVYL